METPPPPMVWENIQVALGHKKHDRKVIPLWWKLGGVAAALVLLFSVANMLFSDNLESFITNDHHLVIEDDTNVIQEINEQLTTNEISQESTNKMNSNIQENQFTVVASQNTIEEVDPSLNKKSSTVEKNILKTDKPFKSTSVVATNNIKHNGKSVISPEKLIAKNSSATISSLEQDNSSIDESNKSSIIKYEAIEKNKIITSTIKEGVAKTNNTKEVIETREKEITSDIQKESIFDAIEEQKEAVAKTTDELPTERWAVSPNVAPVYYNSLSQGSSIDPSFADNTQNGEVNVSYGINVSYVLSPRLTVRSGVSNVNLSYATGGLELATGDASAALQSITFEGKGIIVTAVDRGALSNAAEGSNFDNLTRKATNGDVFLTQNISYTEIPAELTYALLNKKIGINLIGGFSTLLLGNNEVSVSANDFEDVLGEANNLSDVSFSTNVGVGLSYQLSRKFIFNVEPMFKYQLNPYTDSSVQFKPYYVGVYSGLSFKF